LVYSVMDVHMNEDIYTEPEKFDPARFEIGREEDRKVYYGFLGWGTGKFNFLFHVYEQIILDFTPPQGVIRVRE